MSEFYYGKVGKGKSWGLLADKRIVVYRRREHDAEFIAVDSISEASKVYSGSSDDVVYFWDNGDWQEVSFLVQGDKQNVITGFSPR